MITSYVDINNVLSNIKILDMTNESSMSHKNFDEIFRENPGIECVKYKFYLKQSFDSSSRMILDFVDEESYYSYIISRTNTDIISDIKLKVNSNYIENTDLYFGYKNKIRSDISKRPGFIIPVFTMYFLNLKLMIPLSMCDLSKTNDLEIEYNIYVLSDDIRKKIINRKCIVNENMVFNKGVFESYIV